MLASSSWISSRNEHEELTGLAPLFGDSDESDDDVCPEHRRGVTAESSTEAKQQKSMFSTNKEGDHLSPRSVRRGIA